MTEPITPAVMREAFETMMQGLWQIAEEHGFHDDQHPGTEWDNTKLMLIVGEVAEAHEELRAGRAPEEVYFRQANGLTVDHPITDGALNQPEGVPIELADVIIRVMDYAVCRGIDLSEAIALKAAYNDRREWRHGKKF